MSSGILDKAIEKLIDQGIYDKDELFNIVYHKYVVDYAKLREAIHRAKNK